MKYIIMILIVVGLAVADFVTGFIKAYCTDSVQSSKMRKGGLNKLAEIVIMGVAIGSEIGIDKLGHFYGHDELAGIAGTITALAVFFYIFAMEVVSILENYGEINPQANWINKIVAKFGISNDREE